MGVVQLAKIRQRQLYLQSVLRNRLREIAADGIEPST
jgi:hypothetical protein